MREYKNGRIFKPVRWNLVCRDVFGGSAGAFERKNGHSLQAWLNAGVQFCTWGDGVANDELQVRGAGLPLPPVRQHAYGERRRTQTGWGGTLVVQGRERAKLSH